MCVRQPNTTEHIKSAFLFSISERGLQTCGLTEFKKDVTDKEQYLLGYEPNCVCVGGGESEAPRVFLISAEIGS